MGKVLIQCLAMLSIVAAGLYSARPNGHCVMRFQPKRKGYCLRSSACPGAVFRSLCSDTFAETVGCCILEYSRSYPNVESNITLPMFTKIFGDTTRSKAVFKHFLRSLKVAKAVSCAQQSAYITQIAFDTNYLSTMEMVPSEDEASNMTKLKYIGRGGIHISGRKFYEWLTKKTNPIVIGMPELLAFPSLSFHSAAIAWSNSYSSSAGGPLSTTSFNQLADGSKYGLILLSYYLRGHIQNIEKLIKIWKSVNAALKCSCINRDGPLCMVGKSRGRCKIANKCIGRQVESVHQCMGDADIVRCSLGHNRPIQTIVYVEERKNWTHPEMLQRVLKMLRIYTTESGGQLSHKTYSEKELPLEVDWTSKMKKLVVFIHESEGQPVLISHKVPKIERNQSSGLVFLSFMKNRTVDIVYGHFNSRTRVNADDINEGLMDKIYSGPWLLPMRKKTVYTLEKLENILLAINVRSGRSPRPIIRFRILQGGIVVEGVQTIQQMPWYSRNCNTELLNDTIATTQKDMQRMQELDVEYQSLSSSDKTKKTIKTIAINGQAIFSLRGIETNSIAEVVPTIRKVAAIQKLQVNSNPTIVTVSLLAVIVSCSVALVFLCRITKHYKKDECLSCTTKKDSDALRNGMETGADDDVSVEIKPFSEQQNNPEILLANGHKSERQMGLDMDSYSSIGIRSLIMLQRIRTYKVICVLVYNLSAVVTRSCKKSMSSVLLIDYTARYFSNLVYEFLIIEINSDSKNCLDRILVSKTRGKFLLHSILWGVPALVSSIPSILFMTVGQREWRSINALIELCTKGMLFMITLVPSLTRLVYRVTCENGPYRWLKEAVHLIFLLLFTAAWSLSSFEAYLHQFQWLTKCQATVNFFLAMFICTSVYWQMTEFLLVMRQDKLRKRDETYQMDN